VAPEDRFRAGTGCIRRPVRRRARRHPYFGIVGLGIAALFIGAIVGTIGWGACLLLGHGAVGRWSFRPGPVETNPLGEVGTLDP
jgi:hypothetical protein